MDDAELTGPRELNGPAGPTGPTGPTAERMRHLEQPWTMLS